MIGLAAGESDPAPNGGFEADAALSKAKARVSVRSIDFLSSDGVTRIHGAIWEPPASCALATGEGPRGIVQLVHGMSEHIGRYDDFARYLAAQGFVVCGHDHIGHGRSAAAAEDLGHIPLAAGKEALIEDVHKLRLIASAQFASECPYVVFGHSMGSFVAYAYLARHSEGLAGAVLSGTGRLPAALSRAGNILARAICSVRGERYVSRALHSMGAGAYAKRVAGAQTEFDWLSTDPAVVAAYIADPLCGAPFSAAGYAALTDLTHEIATSACARRIPNELPVLFVSGESDPVGDFGAGVRRACALLRAAGASSVDMTLYAGMRHEILNEPDHGRVYADALVWIDQACTSARRFAPERGL